jgi:hypothetical protein
MILLIIRDKTKILDHLTRKPDHFSLLFMQEKRLYFQEISFTGKLVQQVASAAKKFSKKLLKNKKMSLKITVKG